ncbi:unnamed protein product, partial [Owenia fusiformis]
IIHKLRTKPKKVKMRINLTALLLILTLIQISNAMKEKKNKEKKAVWKEKQYRREKSKGIKRPQVADLEQYAVLMACPWKRAFVRNKRPVKCEENADCPNAFFCQKVVNPLNMTQKIGYSVCCRFTNHLCRYPAKNIIPHSSREYVACANNSNCPEDYMCHINKDYSLCCPMPGSEVFMEGVSGCIVNGSMVEAGYKSISEAICTTCECKAQEMVCTSHPDCACEYNNITYANMDQFLDGDCSTCTCMKGTVTCIENRCDSCDIKGYGTISHLQSIYVNTTCESCNCTNGRLSCTNDPACECNDNGKKYNHGSKVNSNDICEDCTCAFGNVTCEPHKKCRCRHDGNILAHGESVTDFDGCTICYCNNKKVSCPKRPQCDTCIHDGKEYKPGKSYMTSDRCQWCVCVTREKSICRIINRKHPKCQNVKQASLNEIESDIWLKETQVLLNKTGIWLNETGMWLNETEIWLNENEINI